MAILEPERERVVLRVVYDGPALAGKTTTVQALAKMFTRPVFSSEDADGRTLHFDWMEYQGGRFEQLFVCCQVVTVPGQEALASRRFKLLESADVIVFVADLRGEELEASLASLESLRVWLAKRPEPRPGLLLQVNKRDLPGGLSLAAVRERLSLGETVGVTESVALEGQGVRQSFVFAVRLALDRVVELRRRGELPQGAPDVESGPALLSALLESEGGTERFEDRRVSAPPAGLVELHQTEAKTSSEPDPQASPPIPHSELPTGHIWPPIEGRLMLHELASTGATVSRGASGDWRGSAGPWLIHSATAGEYSDSEEGRAALLEWARWHSGLGRHLSPRRCIALSGDPRTGWRLWQVVRREATLAQRVVRALKLPEPETIARTLLQAADALRLVYGVVAPSGLRVGLDTVGWLETGPAYVAWAPTPRGIADKPHGFEARPLDLRATFAPIFEQQPPVAGMLEPTLSRLKVLAEQLGQEDLGAALYQVLSSRGWRRTAAG